MFVTSVRPALAPRLGPAGSLGTEAEKEEEKVRPARNAVETVTTSRHIGMRSL